MTNDRTRNERPTTKDNPATQSQYRTLATPDVGALSTVAGKRSNSWKNNRVEFVPIFTF